MGLRQVGEVTMKAAFRNEVFLFVCFSLRKEEKGKGKKKKKAVRRDCLNENRKPA